MRTQTFRFVAAMAMSASLLIAAAAAVSAQSADGAAMAPDGTARMHDDGPAVDHGMLSSQEAVGPDGVASEDPATMADHDGLAPTLAPADGALMAEEDGAMAPANGPGMPDHGR